MQSVLVLLITIAAVTYLAWHFFGSKKAKNCHDDCGCTGDQAPKKKTGLLR